MASLKEVPYELMDSNSANANWEMALDLLVARASLDTDLRQKLLNDPETYCQENGIELPEGTRLVFKNEETNIVVREIPLIATDNSRIQKVKLTERELASSGFNMGLSSTVENTDSVTSEVVGAEVAAVTVAVIT